MLHLDETEIKTCPLCVGFSHLYSVENSTAWNGEWIIKCVECEIEIRRAYVFDPTRKTGDREKNRVKREIIRVWEKRVYGT